MQSLRAFVTLLPVLACTSAPKVTANWVEIAHRSGDSVETKRSLRALMSNDPEGASALAMRLGLPGLADDDIAQWSAQMSAATTSDQVLALTRDHASRRRAAFYRLLQLKDTARAAEVADHPVLSALAHHLGDRPDVRDQALTEAAQDHAPPSSAVRAWHRLRRLNVPQSSPDARSGWAALTKLKAPTEALKRVESAPVGDCLRHLVESLAYEEIGRSAAAADAATKADCLPVQIQRARLLTRLRPAAARVLLDELARRAPLDHNLLMALRQSHPTDSAEHIEALKRLSAWYPGDLEVLRDHLTQLEQRQDWGRAHALCERSLAFRYDDQVHLLSLRYLALSGAKSARHPQHRALMHRLTWLRRTRPRLEALTQLDALVAGADEEGGALGSAATQLRPGKKPSGGAQAPDERTTADESSR